jgi:hypothetical protein
VLLHRIVFRPAFLAEARRLGWAQAVKRVEESCFAIAPRPAPESEPKPLPLARD